MARWNPIFFFLTEVSFFSLFFWGGGGGGLFKKNLTHKKDEAWPGGTPPMLFPELSCVLVPSFSSAGPGVCLPKYHFWLFFCLA